MLLLAMFQDVTQLLTKMGMKEKDASIYLACLHFKEGLYIHEVVTQTNIHRSTIDVCLERLINDGFMNKIKVGARYKYIAQSPESLLFNQESITGDLRALMPILKNLGADKGDTEIRFFEGKEGIARIYDDILIKLKYAEGDQRQLVSFSSGDDVMTLYPNIKKGFIDKRVEMGIWYKAIIPTPKSSIFEYEPYEKELRMVKTVPPEKFPFRVAFETYADSVMIHSPTKPIGGVVIRNHKIADSMRALFHLVWNILPEG